jgi:ribonuclease VapC
VTEAPAFVLDASALLAYLHDEPGADEVESAIAERATIGAINLAETLSKLASVGEDPASVVRRLDESVGHLLYVAPVTLEDAVKIAELMPWQRELDLGLGDRACLALALRLGLPVLTADREWLKLDEPEVRPIRA